MFLHFLCLDTIWVATCQASYRVSSSVPASSGPGAVVSSCLSTLSTMAPTPSSAVDAMPGSPQCCGRPPDPGVAATPVAAHPGGPVATERVSFSDLLYLHHRSRSSREYVGNHFSPTPQGGFCMPRTGRSFAVSTEAVTATPVETAYEDLPMTSSALLPRPALRGESCGGCLCPWFPASSSTSTVSCTPALLYAVYKPLCIQ